MKKCSSTAHSGMFRALCLLLAAVMLMGMFWAGTAVSASAEEPAAETQYGYKTVSQTGDYVHFDVSGIMPKDAELKMDFAGQDYYNYILASLGKTALADNEFLYIYDLSITSPSVESVTPAEQYSVQFYLNEANISVDNMGVIPVASYNDFLASQAAKAAADAEKAEEELAAPADEAEAPAEDVTAPIEDAAAPAEDVTAPVEDVAAPAEPVAAPVEEVAAPVEAAAADAAPVDAAPAEDAAPETAADAEAPADEAAADDAAEAPAEEVSGTSSRDRAARAVSAVGYSANKSVAYFTTNGLGTFALYGTKFDRTAPVVDEPAADDATAVDNSLPAKAPAAEEPVADEQPTDEQPADETKLHKVVVEFLYDGDVAAADAWVAEVEEGTSLTRNVEIPKIVGYEPMDQSGFITIGSTSYLPVNIPAVTSDLTYKIYFKPAIVNYTVKYFEQNVADDNYTLSDSKTLQGLTESTVAQDLAIEKEGFVSLYYDKDTVIAADNSTVIEIYYDRLSYLMSFNLGGGYGTEPIYARYGTPITGVADPVRPGYTFAGWSPALPETMPAANMTYTAQWNVGDPVNYTVVFWYENPNDTDYSYAGSAVASALPGTVVNSVDHRDTNFTDRDASHFKYNPAKAESVTVAGDGSSILNVYFTRNVYTLTFQGTLDTWSYDTITYGTIKAKYQADIADQWPTAGTLMSGSNNKVPSNLCYWEIEGIDAPAATKKYSMTDDLCDTSDGNKNAKAYTRKNLQEYQINYYLESLDDTGVNYKGKYYNLSSEFSQKLNYYYTNGWRYKEIDGFNHPDRENAEESKTGTVTTYSLYYDRLKYDITFHDNYGATTATVTNVMYEMRLNNVRYNGNPLSSIVPAYPAGLEQGAYVFDGWYTTSDCLPGTEADFANATMPNAPLVFYAKWAPISHKVEFFQNSDCTEVATDGENIFSPVEVPHGTQLQDKCNYKNPVNGKYKFVGWFYKDGDVEKAFDFSMPVTKDLKLYAKWASNTPVEYTISYKLQGEDTFIAAPTKGSALPGTSKTFDAKTGVQLYTNYQVGYFPVTNSHNIVFDIVGSNDYTFEYVKRNSVRYTVKYLELGTNAELIVPPKTVDSTKAIVTETFVNIPGYVPTQTTQRLILQADGTNVIIFYYVKDNDRAVYSVSHWKQNISDNGYTLYVPTEYIIGQIGQVYSSAPVEIPGFRYVANNPNPVEGYPSKYTLTLTNNEADNRLSFYYDRIEYPYEFRYLKDGTNEVLADPIRDTARYEATVSEKAKDIPGYRCTSGNTQAITIGIEEGETAVNNVKIFFYEENEVTLNYAVVDEGSGTVAPASETITAVTGIANGSTPTPAADYHFVGWYLDKDCNEQVPAGWVNSETKEITPTKDANKIWVDGTTYYAKFEHDDITLTVTKNITGNFGDKAKEFKIAVSVNGVEVYPNSDDGFGTTGTTGVYTDGTKHTYTVPWGEAVQIYEELDNGYDMYVSYGNVERSKIASKNLGLKPEDTQGDVSVIIENYKDREVDTGVNLDSLPYIIVLAVVVAGAVIVVVRKHRRSYDD